MPLWSITEEVVMTHDNRVIIEADDEDEAYQLYRRGKPLGMSGPHLSCIIAPYTPPPPPPETE